MLDLTLSTIVYHGSDCIVSEPDLEKCNKYKDFGRGFYLTLDKKQAANFAELKRRRNGTENKYVNSYELQVNNDVKILTFEEADEKWFKFVCKNRSEKLSTNNDYDIIIGKIADDSTTTIINNFLSGSYGDVESKEAIKVATSLFLPNRLKDQICIKTNKGLEYMKFISAEEIIDGKK